MNKFSEKLKIAREFKGISQEEFANLIGVSRRAVVAYETTDTLPRKKTLEKMPKALGVSMEYLTNDEIDDPKYGIEYEEYTEGVYEKFGADAAKEVEGLLNRTTALFAGGSIDEAGKDAFFKALVDVYLRSKADAKEKYGKKGK